MKFRGKLPAFIIGILVLIPILQWFLMEPVNARFFDFNSSMTSIGQITGLLGMMLFALNLVISNRAIIFDKFFSGLHHFYSAHKWLGSLSFSLLLFHPLFLVMKFINVSLYDAAMFFVPGNNLANTFGIISLLGMIILLSITLYIKIKYNLWRFSHKFMVLVFILAIFHILFIQSDISRDVFLMSYILFFSFLGLLSGFYRAFLRMFFNRDLSFEVVSISKPTLNVIEIELKPKDFEMAFTPGQFIFVKFLNKNISPEPHPFSISSSMDDKNIKIMVKFLGDYTGNLNKVAIGMQAKIEGPFGEFFDNRNNRKEIWLAGGVGITPFLSLARSLKNVQNDIYLFYCLNEQSEGAAMEELKAISNREKKFHLMPWYSNENGRINADYIKDQTNGIGNTDIYLCGPPPFMKGLVAQFISKGVDKNNINFEEFNFL